MILYSYIFLRYIRFFSRLLIYSTLFFNNPYIYPIATPYKALVTVPIAEITGQPVKVYDKETPAIQVYNSLPICGKTGEYACPRIHQLVYNETVTVLEERNDEILIQIPHVFYITGVNPHKKIDTYWTLKQYVTPYNNVVTSKNNSLYIPEPICHTPSNNVINTTPHQKVITLMAPYYEPTFKIFFSAGTRFVLQESTTHIHQKSQDIYTVWAFDPIKKKYSSLSIPKNYALITHSTPDQQKKDFLKVVRNWAHQKNGFIPYVWGGCSVTHLCTDTQFDILEQHSKNNANVYSYYQWPHYNYPIQPGLDCAGLINRAAQLCGIPFYYKNSFTIGQKLGQLTQKDTLEEGDIIWFPGHVIIVSDLKNNLLIEARGYNHGYGKVHEIPIHEQFKDIKTYDQLIAAYHAQKPIERLKRDGAVASTIYNIKLLKLSSVWS